MGKTSLYLSFFIGISGYFYIMVQHHNIEPEMDVNVLMFINRQQAEKIVLLEHELAQLKRMIFGSKSERFIPTDPAQLQLEIEGANVEQPQELSSQTFTYTRKKPQSKNKAVRIPIPSHLPRKEEIIEPEEIQEGAKKIGEEITEILEYNPGHIYVRKIVRPKYVLPEEGKGVVIAELPTYLVKSTSSNAFATI